MDNAVGSRSRPPWLRALTRGLARLCAGAAALHLAVLAAWFLILRPLGDDVGYLGVVNSLAFILFVPLPATMLVALLTRRRALVVPALAAALLALVLFAPRGALFPPGAGAAAPTLSVMTFNALGTNTAVHELAAAIAAEHADVVLLQELNPAQARFLSQQLDSVYPYRILDPAPGVRGMGALSRFPMTRSLETLPSRWGCRNQVIALDWEGGPVTLVNFHLLPHPESLRSSGQVAAAYRDREMEAEMLVSLASRAGERAAVVAAGDANVTPTNRAYRILTRELTDAWREGGRSLGHTFPSMSPVDYPRLRLGGFPVPDWLVRIDYVLHSPKLRTVEVRTARSDGGSDHRGVIAILAPEISPADGPRP